MLQKWFRPASFFDPQFSWTHNGSTIYCMVNIQCLFMVNIQCGQRNEKNKIPIFIYAWVDFGVEHILNEETTIFGPLVRRKWPQNWPNGLMWSFVDLVEYRIWVSIKRTLAGKLVLDDLLHSFKENVQKPQKQSIHSV